jgi:hypothetical protein
MNADNKLVYKYKQEADCGKDKPSFRDFEEIKKRSLDRRKDVKNKRDEKFQY